MALFYLIRHGEPTYDYMFENGLAVRSIPFVVTPLCYWLTELDFVYYINIALAGIYGLSYTIWAVIEIPRYSRWLKKRYSYSENVNLRWLRIIMYSFGVILTLWLIDCFIVNVSTDGLYLLGSLGMSVLKKDLISVWVKTINF